MLLQSWFYYLFQKKQRKVNFSSGTFCKDNILKGVWKIGHSGLDSHEAIRNIEQKGLVQCIFKDGIL